MYIFREATWLNAQNKNGLTEQICDSFKRKIPRFHELLRPFLEPFPVTLLLLLFGP